MVPTAEDRLAEADETFTGTLTVSTAEDRLAEADETFTVTMTGTTLPSGVTLGTATANRAPSKTTTP